MPYHQTYIRVQLRTTPSNAATNETRYHLLPHLSPWWRQSQSPHTREGTSTVRYESGSAYNPYNFIFTHPSINPKYKVNRHPIGRWL